MATYIFSSSALILGVSSAISSISCSLFFAISAFVFAVVGATLGAISGGLVGVSTKSGFFHGATVGTIVGCILSAEIFKVSFATFDFDHCTIASFISIVEYGSNCLRKTLIQGRFSPTMHVLQETQARNVVHIMQNEVQKNKIILTDKNLVDTLWNGPFCSICLQDFQLGDTVCSLPNCRHTFHLSCICKWFTGHCSCPMCRRRVSKTWIAMIVKMGKDT
ncbi:NEP1-interacting protein-like 1 [Euphorbia lathyris]|uniref:NEP1-interacting protein-like 1 n=1 Tax=Euphorbia lathyris TaxID=212925 RepID=UPI0033143417